MSATTTGSCTAPSNLTFRTVCVVTLMSGPPSIGNFARGSNLTSPGIGVEVVPVAASGGSYTNVIGTMPRSVNWV